MHTSFTPEYTRQLPHFHRHGATFFVTFRLHGSLPASVLRSIATKLEQKKAEIIKQQLENQGELIEKAQRQHFNEYDDALDRVENGPTWLAQPEVATAVTAELNRWDGQWYELLAYAIMPNHVHLLVDFSIQLDENGQLNKKNYKNLSYVINRIKGASARKANLFLARTGLPFWQAGYYDRYIRNDFHLRAVINYIKQNPVKAGLCLHWMEHPHTWSKR